jgi:hypothetical protein
VEVAPHVRVPFLDADRDGSAGTADTVGADSIAIRNCSSFQVSCQTVRLRAALFDVVPIDAEVASLAGFPPPWTNHAIVVCRRGEVCHDTLVAAHFLP